MTATEDRSLAITLTGSDPDAGQTLTYSITTQPADGTLTGLNAATGQVTYQPDAGYLGADSFSFTVTDNGSPPLTSDPATVTVTVEADQPPVVSNSSKSVLENSTLALASADFSGQFSDPIGGDSLQAVQITTLPQRGTLALSGEPVSAGQVIAAAELGDLAYQPAANYSGEDSFQWNGSDGQLYAASPATMSVDVTYVNQAPSFTAGANQAVDENAGRQQVTSWATNISDGPGDKAGQTLSFTVASDNNPGLFAAGPTVDPATGDLSYTPAAGAYGKATLGLILSDNGSTANGGQDSSATAVFSITVEADNPPVVYDSELSMVANHTLALTAADFSGEFSDPNGASLQSIQVTALPQQGTLALAGQAVSAGQVIAAGNLGNLTYQPAAGTTGSDSLQWNAFDGQLDATSIATMTITVTTDEPPVIFRQRLGDGGELHPGDVGRRFDRELQRSQRRQSANGPDHGPAAARHAGPVRRGRLGRRGNRRCGPGQFDLSARGRLPGAGHFPVDGIRRVSFVGLLGHGDDHRRGRPAADALRQRPAGD